MESQQQEAKATATKHVVNMLQRPGQLEKVEQYRRRMVRKKASVEAMLKTAMHSQLDGVQVGLDHLKTALNKIKSIEHNLDWVGTSFVDIPEYSRKLREVREENMRHSQYVTAIENLKHIFTVPESVEKTKQWINDGKLLYTHQSLIDLENSRDDLLFELHKLPNQAQADKIMLKTYFEEVEELSELLEKQLWLVLSRTLNTVRKEPTVVVTALRVVEREERADVFAEQRHRQTGFMAPGRPKRWRAKALSALERAVAQRVEGSHVQDRGADKLWLVRYLELTRRLILEDLRVVKTLCVPCFPPHYQIFEKLVSMYHTSLSRHLEELIQSGLEGNEYVSMMSWCLNTYAGPELLRHPELDVDATALGPLLVARVLADLRRDYLANVRKNFTEWMHNTLESEKADWSDGKAPESADHDGHYLSAAPVIVFQMIDQNLQVAETVSRDLTFEALLLSFGQVSEYGRLYGSAVADFGTKHFEDRSKVPYFTQYMITVVNNCSHFAELAEQTKRRYWAPGPRDDSDAAAAKFEELLSVFREVRDDAGRYLLHEAFLDLDGAFQALLTPKWAADDESVATICVTLEDYFQDYAHLRPPDLDRVLGEARDLVARRYVAAVLRRRPAFKNVDERRSAALKIAREADRLRQFFARVAPGVLTAPHSPFDVIDTLAEVLKIQDPEILSLELHGVVDKYPDVTRDHLVQLLTLRGDISRSEAAEKVAFIFQTNRNRDNAAVTKSIFSQI